MKIGPAYRGEAVNRAVSPVIGVILMVAITVILAAVIGAFVLEIGDQQETAPNTSFDSEQEMIFLKAFVGAPDPEDTANTTQVHVSHAGGDVLDISQVRLSVNGNTSTYGLYKSHEQTGFTNQLVPQPEIWKTWGTNQRAEFSSGQTWNTIIFCGSLCQGDDEPLRSIENLPIQSTHMYTQEFAEENGEGKVFIEYDNDPANGAHTWDHLGWGDLVESQDTVRVVWTAESGGKTQVLFKYTVQ